MKLFQRNDLINYKEKENKENTRVRSTKRSEKSGRTVKNDIIRHDVFLFGGPCRDDGIDGSKEDEKDIRNGNQGGGRDGRKPSRALKYKIKADRRLAKLRAGKSDSFLSFCGFVALMVISFIWFELFYHLFAYGGFDARIYMLIASGLFLGAFFAFVCSCLPGIVRRITAMVLLFAAWFFAGAQLVYFHIFGTSLSFSQFGMGGDAINTFKLELGMAISDIKLQLLVMAIPLLVAAVCLFFPGIMRHRHFGLKKIVACFALFVMAWIATVGLSYVGGKDAYSCYELYHSNAVSTDLSVKIIGVYNTARIELKYMIFGGGEDNTALEATGSQRLSGEVGFNTLEIDFDAMAEQDENATLKMLDEYFAAADATPKNEYTGYFEGYNLIELCCESFSPVFINAEMTPMLYEMYSNGFIFNNFYTPWESNTTNGEYTMCTGLFPDNSRSKSNGSFKASIGHTLPFTLGNMFTSIGAKSYGYHNYLGSYYDRNKTYPTIGLDAKFARAGMKFTNSWPASDLEMMEQSVGDYINDSQFFVHYMTFSGHYRYDYNANGMVRLNWSKVQSLPYSTRVKGYISCNLELEYALEYLVDELTKAGVADHTVIALSCDHFPYGLTLEEYSELAGYDVDNAFGKYRNAFILWTPSMEQSVVTTDAMCTVDILPTLLNLWGFDYDSRLLAGRDIFADCDHVAILSNGSYVTDKVMFDSSTNSVINLVKESDIPDDYVQNLIEEVKKRFTVSTQILNTDYYGHIPLFAQQQNGNKTNN